jgi:hypothetical protein
MRKFIRWICIFTCLLAAVPLLAANGQLVLAKVVGVALILIVSIALRIWLRNANRIKMSPDAIKFTINDRFSLAEWSPLYKVSSRVTKKEIEKRLGKLVSELAFDRFDRKEVEGKHCLAAGLMLIYNVWDLNFHSAIGKVIIFWDEKGMVLEEKEGQILLFVNIEEWILQLAMFQNLSDISKNTGDEAPVLRSFYQK